MSELRRPLCRVSRALKWRQQRRRPRQQWTARRRTMDLQIFQCHSLLASRTQPSVEATISGCSLRSAAALSSCDFQLARLNSTSGRRGLLGWLVGGQTRCGPRRALNGPIVLAGQRSSRSSAERPACVQPCKFELTGREREPPAPISLAVRRRRARSREPAVAPKRPEARGVMIGVFRWRRPSVRVWARLRRGLTCLGGRCCCCCCCWRRRSPLKGELARFELN